jgi:hypothetical protein
VRPFLPGGRALPAPRPHCPKSADGGGYKQRKPPLSSTNVLRAATTTTALLDQTTTAALPPGPRSPHPRNMQGSHIYDTRRTVNVTAENR